MTSAIFHFQHASHGQFSLILRSGGDPDSLRTSLRRACAGRRSEVFSDPSGFGASLIRCLLMRQPRSVAIASEQFPKAPADFLYRFSLVGDKLPHLSIEEQTPFGQRQPYAFHGPFFAFLGHEHSVNQPKHKRAYRRRDSKNTGGFADPADHYLPDMKNPKIPEVPENESLEQYRARRLREGRPLPSQVSTESKPKRRITVDFSAVASNQREPEGKE